MKRKKDSSLPPKKQQAIVLPINPANTSLDFLVAFVDKIRPANPKNIEQAELRFKSVLYQLTQEKSSLYSLRKALLTQILKTHIVFALTESGIVSSRGFIQELMGKIKHKFIPALQTDDDFLYVINKIFFSKKDYIWVYGIDKSLWCDFFELLGIQINLTEQALINQLNQSLQLLSYRITTLGLEKEISQKFENFQSAIFPFLEQNRLINEYLHSFKINSTEEKTQLYFQYISETLNNCNQSIQWINDHRSVSGTSLSEAYILTRLQQQIDRIFILIDVLDMNNSIDTERFVEFFQKIVQNENKKNSIRLFLSENTGYLAYQIAEHGGRRGEGYITNSKQEYWKMFLSACGGGFIISFIGVIKNLLGKLTMPPFWHGFLYSVNYSLGFILIQDTGSTLATKQPAYTANNVASSLDVKKTLDRPDLLNLAITIAKVSRSQIASFAGNLLIVFPMSYLLAVLFFQVSGSKIVDGEAAHQLLIDQQPFHSMALLYACFTGFFLFLSGLVAGFIENYIIYGKITERINKIATFRNHFNEKNRYKILHYVESNLGTFIGNISLGFFLGMAGFIGKIFGIPFDIRHITISAANTAIGYFGMDHHISTSELVYTLFGVGCIGLLNFAVSFGMAFIVAVKSRGIHLREYPEFLSILWRYFKKNPGDFVKPPTEKNSSRIKE